MNAGAVVTALALLALNAFFVASEFALVAARRARIAQLAAEGNRSARFALASIEELSLTLAGAQLGITMTSLGLGAVAEPAVHHSLELAFEPLHLPEGVSYAVTLALALGFVSFLHMVLGEMAPKSLAISGPERLSLLIAAPFRLFVSVFRPALRLLNASGNGVVRLVGVTPQDEVAITHSPSELAMLLEESAEHGTLESADQTLLTRAIEMSGLDAEQVMVHRSAIVAVPSVADLDAIEEVARESGRSRLPVYDGDLDQVVGVLHVKDLLRVSDDDPTTLTAADLARPALITPESRPIEDVMVDMRAQRQHIAVVVDEYGSLAGLVALEDLLEELIGEFEDESDRRSWQVRHRPDGSVLLPGSLRPDELPDAVGLSLPDGDWETLAGYVLAELGRVPDVGNEIEVDGQRLIVDRMDGNRIAELRLHPAES